MNGADDSTSLPLWHPLCVSSISCRHQADSACQQRHWLGELEPAWHARRVRVAQGCARVPHARQGDSAQCGDAWGGSGVGGMGGGWEDSDRIKDCDPGARLPRPPPALLCTTEWSLPVY